MPWAQRGPYKYYYRSVRQGTCVTKEYVGTGPLAELCATEDAARQAQRQVEAEVWHQKRAALDARASSRDSRFQPAGFRLSFCAWVRNRRCQAIRR